MIPIVRNRKGTNKKICYLVINNKKYQSLLKNALYRYTIYKYYWINLIKDYEICFISVYKNMKRIEKYESI